MSNGEANGETNEKEYDDDGIAVNILLITWVVSWMFTIGFSHLSFWQGVLALAVWPYYLGDAISRVVG